MSKLVINNDVWTKTEDEIVRAVVMNYGNNQCEVIDDAEIPFEKKLSAGFSDTSDEHANPMAVNYSKKRQHSDIKLIVDREVPVGVEEQQKLKTKEENDIQIEMLNNNEPLRKRSKLAGPEPQISNAELQQVAKFESSSGAQNVKALTHVDTSLKGGLNTPLYNPNFGDVSLLNATPTPNTILSKPLKIQKPTTSTFNTPGFIENSPSISALTSAVTDELNIHPETPDGQEQLSVDLGVLTVPKNDSQIVTPSDKIFDETDENDIQIEMLNNNEPLRKRSKLAGPEPQISNAELQQVAKCESSSGAQNVKTLTHVDTSLKGGLNTPLYNPNFGDVSLLNAIPTPNTILSTPLKIQKPTTSTFNTPGSIENTPSISTPTSAVTDELNIHPETPDGQEQLSVDLRVLPVLKNDSQIVTPSDKVFDETADNQDNNVIKDQADTNAGKQNLQKIEELIKKYELYFCNPNSVFYNPEIFLTNTIKIEKKIADLPEGIFSGLDFLNNLYLVSTQLKNLRPGTFDDLTNLEFLILMNNRLGYLPKQVFSKLKSLTFLDLRSNKIEFLEPNTFNGCINLQFLFIGENNLTIIPHGLFNDLKSLKALSLNLNKLTCLLCDTFNGLRNLTFLDISNNSLKSISQGAFNGLDSLTDLDLKSNELTCLDSNVFNHLYNLNKLNIMNNSLTYISQETFHGLKSLQSLYLGLNKLKKLEPDTFEKLFNLKYLCFRDNNLTFIPQRLFNDLKSLEELILQSNQLLCLDPDIFNGLRNLTLLDISDNSLISIPKRAFNGLKSLTNLDLNSNELTRLESFIFNRLSNLKELNVSINSLTFISQKAFKGLKSLKYLFLGSNRLTRLRIYTFNNLSNLEDLDLSDNSLTSIEPKLFNKIKCFKSLKRLFLQSNKLRSLKSNTFNSFPKLEVLDISGNCLMDLPFDIFKKNPKLTTLSLEPNEPVEFKPRVFTLLS